MAYQGAYPSPLIIIVINICRLHGLEIQVSLERFTKLSRRGLALLAASSLFGLAACGSGGDTVASSDDGGLPSEIKIVAIRDKTGPVAYTGNAANKGSQLAVEQINNERFLGDTKLVLEERDTAGKAQTAASMVTAAIQDKSYAAILGPVASDQAAAASALVGRGKMPIIYTQSGADGVVTNEYTFRVTPPMASYYPKIGEYIKDQGIKTLGVVYNTTNPTLKEVAEKVLPQMSAGEGFKITEMAAAQSTTQDFSAPISKVVATKPDGVALLLLGAQNTTAIRQLRQTGYSGPVITSPSAGGGNLASAGKEAAGMTWPTDFHPDQPNESSQKFVELYKAKYGEEPLNYAAEAYDATWMLARAIKQAGSASREAIQKGLDAVAAEGFEGALGRLTFENRDLRLPGVLVQWDGTKEVLLSADS